MCIRDSTRNAGILAATALGAFAVSGSMASPADKPSDADNFYKSDRVSQQEVCLLYTSRCV